MNILHDKSSVKSSSAKWIDRGYAREDVHSLDSNMSTPQSSGRQTVRFAMTALTRRTAGSNGQLSQKTL